MQFIIGNNDRLKEVETKNYIDNMHLFYLQIKKPRICAFKFIFKGKIFLNCEIFRFFRSNDFVMTPGYIFAFYCKSIWHHCFKKHNLVRFKSNVDSDGDDDTI